MLASLPSVDLTAGEGLETQIRRVRLGDGHVLVARLTTGEVVAFAPVCPHQFTELDEATIRDGQLRCPRHGYLYDTRGGENIHPGRETLPENRWKVRPGYLPCFEVWEQEGRIWVSDQTRSPPASYDPALEERPAGSGDPEAGPAAAAAAGTGTGTATGAGAAGTGAGGAGTGEGAPVAGAGGAVEQSVKFLTVTSGSTFDIRLPGIPRPGFAWQFEILGQLLQVVDEQFESGFSPCHLVRVTAQGAGAATLTCFYADARGERAEVRTFIVRVQPA